MSFFSDDKGDFVRTFDISGHLSGSARARGRPYGPPRRTASVLEIGLRFSKKILIEIPSIRPRLRLRVYRLAAGLEIDRG
jgi:hypothetical protein